MSRINKYKLFLESNKQISILDFLESVKPCYHYKGDEYMRKWSNHFIGDGWFDRIKDHINIFIKSLENVDLEYIDDRFYDIWDKYPIKSKWINYSIISSDYKNETKYNSSFILRTDKSIDYIICDIIYKILSETTSIRSPFEPYHDIRKTHDELYVTDEIYNCENFNIDNYPSLSDLPNYLLEKFKLYSPENILKTYRPAIFIKFGHHSERHMYVKEIENDIDYILPSILPTIDYDEVIWDHGRYHRYHGSRYENFKIYDYTIKIVLK